MVLQNPDSDRLLQDNRGAIARGWRRLRSLSSSDLPLKFDNRIRKGDAESPLK